MYIFFQHNAVILYFQHDESTISIENYKQDILKLQDALKDSEKFESNAICFTIQLIKYYHMFIS